MPRVCRVCIDRRLTEIDEELKSGKSVPQIAREVGLPESNLYRHRKDHLGLAKSIMESAPAAAISTIQFLQARDAELAAVVGMAVRRGHTQAAVAGLNQRIRIGLEISALRDEMKPQEKRILHVHLDKEQAERIARSYMRHQVLSEEVIHVQAKQTVLMTHSASREEA